MKRYPEYRNSGVEWIREIPQHWNLVRVKHLSPVKRGASPRPIDDPKYFNDDGEFAWVRIADVSSSERYLETTTQRLSELGASLSVKRYPGDLFVSIAGTVGKPIITKIKCCIHDGFVYFPDLKLNPEYVYYMFTTGKLYEGLGKWGTQLNLNTETIGDIAAPVPTDTEVQAIITYLDRKTSQIDRLIDIKRRQIAVLQEERTAIINQAVTRGLNPNAPMKDSGIEWIGEIPEEWEVSRLGFLSDNIGDGIHSTPQYVDESEYYFINGNNLTNGSIVIADTTKSVSKEEFDKYRLHLDDRTILLSINGTIGNVAYYGGESVILGKSAAYIICGSDLSRYFLFYLLQSSIVRAYFNREVTGTTIYNLSLKSVRDTPILLCSLDEQASIVQFLEDRTAEIDRSISQAERQIELLQEYRTTLISDAVTGKIDVREEAAA